MNLRPRCWFDTKNGMAGDLVKSFHPISSKTVGRVAGLLLACLSVFSAAVGLAKGAASELPPRYLRYPFSVMSLTVGHPNDGHQIRAKKLSDTAHLFVKASSVHARYGHPALVLMLRRSAKEISSDAGGIRMLVGDLSREGGGALYGHRSHQSGRDADVGFFAINSKGKSVQLAEFVKFEGDGKAVGSSNLIFDDYRNWLLIQAWVTDTRAGLSHIFVSHGLRARLLSFAAKDARFKRYVGRAAELLKQPEHGEPHDDHFHVRIACPKSQAGLCKSESARH